MAVRHGYGKIAGTDALVFAYDTGDTRNSYRGEPTVNLVSNPIVGDYGNAPGSSTNTISPDGTNNATIPIPNAAADRYQETVAGGLYSSGTQFTYSWHYKQLATHTGITPNEQGGLYVYGLVNCSLVGSVTKIKDLSNGWSRWKATFQITDGSLESIFRLYFGYVVGVDGSSAAYYGHQFEQKSYATQFVNGTRSSTQGLLDLTGNSTIDLAYASFDSNAQMTFDGTDDYVDLGAGHTTFTNKSFAVEAILYPNTSPPAQQVFFAAVGPVGGLQKNIHFRIYDSGACRMGFYSNDLDTAGGLVNFGQYNHVVMQYNYDLDTSYIYVNGELSTSGDQGPFTDSSAQIGIGYWPGSGQYFNGEIPVTKLYNRVLTADEVRNNYRHYKTRFDIQ